MNKPMLQVKDTPKTLAKSKPSKIFPAVDVPEYLSISSTESKG